MCGILGWVGVGQAPERALFQHALDTLSHRGPDDEGIWQDDGALLGHRRLSILDLTSAGHQPMVDTGSGATIVFNGEIYNYIELRDELAARGHRFTTECDTEVLLRAMVEWGVSALGKLNGMWAFGIWFPRTRTLLLARDRFGVKPLCFSRSRGRLAFASEPKALLALDPSLRRVNRQTLYELLARSELYVSNASFYEGIDLVPPAHYAEYRLDSDTLRMSRYWDYPQEQAPLRSAAEESEEFAALLEDAVRLRLRSDVPVGVTLSGGLDSSAILAASVQGDRAANRVCFTSVYGAGGAGEAPWAREAAGSYGMAPVEVEAPRERWETLLSEIGWHLDGPGYSPAVYPLWCLMSEARERGVPVLLEGQGADELIGGYPHYSAVAILEALGAAVGRGSPAALRRARDVWAGAARAFTGRRVALWMMREMAPGLVDLRRDRLGLTAVLRPEVFADARHSVHSRSVSRAPAHMDAMTARLWSDHSRDILPGLLHYGDAMSMAHSIESRLPFMDVRLVEWFFARPAERKTANGATKWMLRDFLRSRGLPRIADRHEKLGYPTPADQWLAADNGAILRSSLLAGDSRIREFCDPRELGSVIDRFVGGAAVGNHLYRLLSTEAWLRSSLGAAREPGTIAIEAAGA
jgi:asparagine synthase (glutamine-hydrolysing)